MNNLIGLSDFTVARVLRDITEKCDKIHIPATYINIDLERILDAHGYRHTDYNKLFYTMEYDKSLSFDSVS